MATSIAGICEVEAGACCEEKSVDVDKLPDTCQIVNMFGKRIYGRCRVPVLCGGVVQ